MKTLGKVKVGFSIFGLLLSLATINAASAHMNIIEYNTKAGNAARVETARGFMYFNMALTVILVGASLKTLLDKGTYED